MKRSRLVCFALFAALVLPAPARAEPVTYTHDGVTVEIGDTAITLSNGIVERTWPAAALRTLSVGRVGQTFDAPADDFSLLIDGAAVKSGDLQVVAVEPYDVPGGAGIRWILGTEHGPQVTRTVEAYSGIAGFESQTTVTSRAALALSGYTLDTIAVADPAPLAASTTIHAFRAGADWRDANWRPLVSIGEPHGGDFRESKSAVGEALSGPAQWMSISTGAGDAARLVSLVSERRDYASSRMTYEGATTGLAHADVDLSRDVVYIGPFEEDAHAENPGPGQARRRLFGPAPVALEPAFTIFPADADDEAWQFHTYLTRHRKGAYEKRVMFNSDKVDTNAISTGAKDDMSYTRFTQILPAVRAMGFDTFIFDDGWMARSGDWCPDSDECPEPRWDGEYEDTPGSKFRPRFPDPHFKAVRADLEGDPETDADDIDLGLWMTPMAFNPHAKAFQMNPQWACMPISDALAAYNLADGNSSSNEAGIGLWNPRAMGVNPDDPTQPMRLIDYIEDRIRRAIVEWRVTYFKFDFLVWVDCGGAEPVTMYEYHDEFVDMIDRLQADHPGVTYSIDETNDYRMFPFESTARGPAWFLNNGGSSNAEILHAVWNLSPFIPGYSLGMRSLGAASHDLPMSAIDAAMASSLLGHLTISLPVDERLTPEQRQRVRAWTDFYHANSDTLAGMTYAHPDDPVANRWTALQSWNGDTKSGWLLAFRQSGTGTSRAVALRGLGGVPDAAEFHVVREDPGADATTDLGLRTAAELRGGLDVQIAQPGGYAIYRITRVS